MAREVVELPENDWQVIGAFLRRSRGRRNWTQDQVVAAGGRGLSKAPLSLLENGKPQSNRPLRATLEGIQRAYGLPDDWWVLVLAGELEVTDEPAHSETTDYNSRLARMPDHVLQAVNDIIDAEERRRGLS